MTNFLILIFSLFPVLVLLAQSDKEGVFMVVDQQPEPVGGMKGFNKFLRKNLEYPWQARRSNVQGRVLVQFIVDEKGNITEVEVLKGIHAGFCEDYLSAIDLVHQEAVRVMKLSPSWIPGKQKDKAVKVKLIIPILFSL